MSNSQERVEAVRRTGLLDTAPEETFDRLTRLASNATGAPVAFISLVDANRDFYKSQFGFGEPLATSRQLTGVTFCHLAIAGSGPLVIEDTRQKPEHACIPSVESLGASAYLGVPLVDVAGHAIGSLCAIDFSPRAWHQPQIDAMTDLAATVMREIELRTRASDARDQASVAVAERAESERIGRRLAFLYHSTSAILDTAPQSEGQLATLAELAVPDLCDWCAVYRCSGPGQAVLQTLTHSDPTLGALAESFRGQTVTVGAETFGLSRVFSDGEPELVTAVPAPMLGGMDTEDSFVGLLRAVRAGSYMIVPIAQDARADVAVAFLSAESNRRYAADDLELAMDLCRRAGLVMANARMLDERQRRLEFEQQLLGIVSHDLRNPISVMIMSATVLQNQPDADDVVMKVAQRIVSSGERAGRMIRDLLDFTQARLGDGIPIEPRTFDVHDLAREMVDQWSVMHPGRPIELSLHGSGHGEWDRDRLAQAIGNIVDNAVAYGPAGTAVGIEIRDLKSGVVISVHNTGPAIPESAQRELFKPLVRGTTAGAGGRSIGLGLYIVDQIVRAHHGSVVVHSDDQRTTFSVTLPKARHAV